MRKAAGLYVQRFGLTLVAAGLASLAILAALSIEARRAGTSWLAGSILGLIMVCLYLEVWFFRRANPVADGYVGERIVGRVLDPLEAEGYWVLGPRRWSRRGDIDQIVVGPTGVFAIEVKAWKGRMAWSGDRLVVAGRDRTRKVRKSIGHAMCVKEKIPPELGLNWVEAVTVFAEAFPSVGCRNKKSYWTVPAEDLPGFILSRRKRLTEEEVALIASALN
jgi:Holliday junction resolvase-like predicted endonuclease